MSPPWMSFYPADYLGATGHLSTAEHGAYLLLILHYWQKGGLPTDEAQLARICRWSPEEWAASRSVLAGFFGENWRHKRIDAELQVSETKYLARANAGRLGGIAKAKAQQARSNASGNATAKGLAKRKPGSTNHNHNPSGTLNHRADTPYLRDRSQRDDGHRDDADGPF